MAVILGFLSTWTIVVFQTFRLSHQIWNLYLFCTYFKSCTTYIYKDIYDSSNIFVFRACTLAYKWEYVDNTFELTRYCGFWQGQSWRRSRRHEILHLSSLLIRGFYNLTTSNRDRIRETVVAMEISITEGQSLVILDHAEGLENEMLLCNP